MAGTYRTEGRRRLMDFLRQHPDRQYTAEELAAEIGRADSSGDTLSFVKCSKSSLYRHLSELCAEGTVRKYRSDTQSAYVYQYIGGGDCCHHFHLKCLACGELIHLECAVSEELLSHIATDHHFAVDSGRSILYGLCEVCAEAHASGSRRQTNTCSCGCSHDHRLIHDAHK